MIRQRLEHAREIYDGLEHAGECRHGRERAGERRHGRERTGERHHGRERAGERRGRRTHGRASQESFPMAMIQDKTESSATFCKNLNYRTSKRIKLHLLIN